MEKSAYLFNCKVEELPVIALFLKAHYEKDQAAFADFSPSFNAAYLSAFAAELAAADEVVNPVKFTEELKAITQRLTDTSTKLRPLIDRLEGYVGLAKSSLTISPKGFGFSALRKAISTKDMEEVLGALKVVIQHVDDNLAALQAQGYTAAAHAELSTIQAIMKTDNQAQDAKLSQRRDHVQANIDLLNTLWTRMQQVMQTGKILYKSTNPAKVNDYTMASLLKRVRQDRKKGNGGEVVQPPAG